LLLVDDFILTIIKDVLNIFFFQNHTTYGAKAEALLSILRRRNGQQFRKFCARAIELLNNGLKDILGDKL
jgi:hypothetical protein